MTLTAYDELSICNNGLSLVGARPINSIKNANKDPEATCANLYPMVIADLLSRHEWNFPTKVKQLAHNPDAETLEGYAYAYKLPNILMAGPLAIYSAEDLTRPRHDYINANDHIHTNLNSCYVKYLTQVLVETWPPYFVNLASHAMGTVLAVPVMDDGARATELRIITYGAAQERGEGGLLAAAKIADAKAEPIKSLFKNGDPLTSMVY